MKKTLLAIGALALLAASCNSSVSRQTPPPAVQNPPPAQSMQQSEKSSASVDAAINELTAGIESEEKINFETDDDVVVSDNEVIADYEGVSDGSY